MARVEWNRMTKEQVLILKVRYDEGDLPPNTWNWGEIVDNGHVAEVLNHGTPEDSSEN